MTEPARGPAVTAWPRSAVEGIAWPAVPDGRAAPFLAVLFELDQTQWWTPEQLLEYQLRQVSVLAAHAADTVPFYRRRLRAAGMRLRSVLTLDEWRRLPILTRAQAQAAELRSSLLPRGHGARIHRHTTGADAAPLEFESTSLADFLERAFTLRDHQWHARAPAAKLLAVRGLRRGARLEAAPDIGWGRASAAVYDTAPAVICGVDTAVAEQLALLRSEEPSYLLTYPSHLRRLLRGWQQQPFPLPRLRQVLSTGEVLEAALRAQLRAAWRVPLADTYACAEAGQLAFQCPAHEHLHVQAERVLLEVLDAQGRPCAPGTVGRVVVTPLHNFATPLLRYELGDYAELGPPCPCGRGLPVLRRVAGRATHRLQMPGGEPRVAPPLAGLFEQAGVAEWQLVQRGPLVVEARVVPEGPWTPAAEQSLKEALQGALEGVLQVLVLRLERLPTDAAGRVEPVICRLGVPAAGADGE